MRYVYMSSYLTDGYGSASDYMDVRLYRANEFPLERIQDEFLHLFFLRAKRYAVPRHVELLQPDDATLLLRIVARYRDGSSLWAFLQQEDTEEVEAEYLDAMQGKETFPHYGVDLSSGYAHIADCEYTEDSYVDCLERFLKGDSL